MSVGNPVVLSVSSCLRLCYNARAVSRSGEGGFQIACFFLFIVDHFTRRGYQPRWQQISWETSGR